MSDFKTEEAASLRRIREQTRVVDACEVILARAETIYQDAKGGLTAAKETHMQALRDLRDISREETIGLPLFPVVLEGEEVSGEEAPEPEPEAAPVEDNGEPDDRDATTFLTTIGIKSTVSRILGEEGIQTVADLRNHLSGEHELDEITGIGRREATHILDKLKKWDEENG